VSQYYVYYILYIVSVCLVISVVSHIYLLEGLDKDPEQSMKIL